MGTSSAGCRTSVCREGGRVGRGGWRCSHPDAFLFVQISVKEGTAVYKKWVRHDSSSAGRSYI